MELRRIWTLGGPNIWANFPVIEAVVDLRELEHRSSAEIPGFNDRLKAWLPSLIEHRCSIGQRGGFFERLARGTYMAHILEHVCLELQTLSGTPVGYGKARETDEPGVYKVIVEYEEEELARTCLGTAHRMCLAAVHDREFDAAAELKRLRDLCHAIRLGPSTGAIARAARARGIPMRRLNRDSMVQLGHGARQRRFCAAETDRTGAIAEAIAQDKQLTRTLLEAVGVPVPRGRPVSDADDAWAAAQEIGTPVVVKPQFGNHGRGVTTNLTTRQQVLTAYAAARPEGANVVVERYIAGDDHRLLVIGDRLVAAALREPAHVIGDGRSTVRQLVDEVNRDPRRSDGHATVLSYIKLDPIGLTVLAEQGYSPDSIPPVGERVLIRRNGNLSTGGTATDVTDRVHPDVAAQAVDAARVIGLDVAGVDILAADIGRPLEEQNGAVVEVNAGPGLRMHLEPSAGSPRPVGEAIIDLLYPAGASGRIPIVAFGGTEGHETAVRLAADLLRSKGWRVAATGRDGAYLDGRRIRSGDCTGLPGQQAVLLNPKVDAAVFQTSPEGIYREGLGFDHCDVGVISGLSQGDNGRPQGVDTIEELCRLVRCVVEAVPAAGAAVLNADDPLVTQMAEQCRCPIIWASRQGGAVVAEHRQRGGRAVVVRDGMIVLAEGDRKESLGPLPGLPEAADVDGVLGAVAAAWALEVPRQAIQSRLAEGPDGF